jgi:hypothetical protein
MHPPASIQPSLQLHARSAHASGQLLALDPIDHTLPPDRVICAHRAALANAQHRIQIASRLQNTMSVAGQLWLATKTPMPKR